MIQSASINLGMKFHYSIVGGKVYLSRAPAKRGDSDCVEISRRNSASPVSPEDEELYSRVMKRSQHQDEVYSRIMKRLLKDHEDQDEMYSRVMKKRSPEFLENGQTPRRLCPDSAAELRHLSGKGLDMNHQMSLFSLNW